MSDTTLVPAIKENGVKQREDVALTGAIALALVARILNGDSVYMPDKQPTSITIVEDGVEKAIEIPHNTLSSWVVREVVIPGDNRKLRDVLDEAREEKKRKDREIRQLDIIETSEKALQELVNIPIESGKMITTKFRKNKRGFAAYGKVETEFQGVNPKLAEAKIKALTFGLERLQPDRYSQRLTTQNTHLMFSLADLRRAKERRDESLVTQPQ